MRSAFTLVVLLGLLLLAALTGFWAWQEVGEVEIGTHGWIALGLGAALTFLVGAGLMALMFFSARGRPISCRSLAPAARRGLTGQNNARTTSEVT